MNLNGYIRDIHGFPKEGIVFKDITPIFLEPRVMRAALDEFLKLLGEAKIDKVVGIESRGFFFATLLAHRLDAGFVPMRKPGKLPYEVLSASYDLEYGSDSIEVHADAIREGEKVLVHDDVLATGGTAAAACQLVEQMKGEIVQVSFLMELAFLKGREKLKPYRVESLLEY